LCSWGHPQKKNALGPPCDALMRPSGSPPPPPTPPPRKRPPPPFFPPRALILQAVILSSFESSRPGPTTLVYPPKKTGRRQTLLRGQKFQNPSGPAHGIRWAPSSVFPPIKHVPRRPPERGLVLSPLGPDLCGTPFFLTRLPPRTHRLARNCPQAGPSAPCLGPRAQPFPPLYTGLRPPLRPPS